MTVDFSSINGKIDLNERKYLEFQSNNVSNQPIEDELAVPEDNAPDSGASRKTAK